MGAGLRSVEFRGLLLLIPSNIIWVYDIITRVLNHVYLRCLWSSVFQYLWSTLIDTWLTSGSILNQHLNQYLANTGLTLDWHLDWHAIETWSMVGQWLAGCRLTHMYWLLPDSVSAKISVYSWPTVKWHVSWVSIEKLIKCRSQVLKSTIDGSSTHGSRYCY